MILGGFNVILGGLVILFWRSFVIFLGLDLSKSKFR